MKGPLENLLARFARYWRTIGRKLQDSLSQNIEALIPQGHRKSAPPERSSSREATPFAPLGILAAISDPRPRSPQLLQVEHRYQKDSH